MSGVFQHGYNAFTMLVKDLGEFELIDTLAAAIADANRSRIQSLGARGLQMLRAIGDDAAAWHSPAGVRVATTDTMVEGIHFDLRYTGWADLGWKALATNVSDVAAMGCVPSYATVTLGLRGDIPVDGLVEMYRGMMELTAEYGGVVIGGDIVKSPVFFISVSLEGIAEGTDEDSLMLRDKAQVGDLIAVTGSLGSSSAGLQLLMEGADAAGLASYDFLTLAHNRPVPRVTEGERLVSLGVRCAMDVSDGLVDDLGKLCRAASVGARIRAQQIPIDDRLKAAYPATCISLALGGGEDYELLFAANTDVIRRAQESIETAITVIGEIVEAGQGVTVLDHHGEAIKVATGGWDHFRA